jgi:hypothetical protein
MKLHSNRRVLSVVLGAGVVSLAMATAPLAANADDSFGPKATATGLRVSLLTLHQSLAATGVQTTTNKTADLLATPVGLPAAADVLHSVANASNSANLSASTSVADVNIPGVLSASVVTGSASGLGGCDGPSVYSGTVSIDNLVVGGKPIPTNPVQPNTKIPLPGLITVTLNEQTKSPSGILVRAIHVTGPLGLDVIVGESGVVDAYCYFD